MKSPPPKRLRIELPSGETALPAAADESAPSVASASLGSDAVQSPPPERFFRVTRTAQVPDGFAYFTLPRGMVLSSIGYDIDRLQRIGVPLEEVAGRDVPAPATLL